MAKTYHALVCCRAGMGSSMMLKIKIDQVIKENNLPVETEHGNLDSLIGFTGDLVITMGAGDVTAMGPQIIDALLKARG